MFDLANRACNVVEAAYRAGQRAARAAAAESRFLERLLAGDDEGDQLDVPDGFPAGPYLVLAIVTLDGDPPAVRDLTNRLPSAIATGLRPDPLPHRVGLVPAGHADTDELASWARQRGTCVVVQPARGRADIARAYDGFRRRLVVVPAAGRAGVLGPVDLTGPWLASLLDPEERFGDVASVLGPVLARRVAWATKDVEVLQALAATGGVIEETADRLGVTPRQLRRHAAEAAARLNLVLDDPLDQVKLGWALLLLRTGVGQLPAPGDPAWARLGARPPTPDGHSMRTVLARARFVMRTPTGANRNSTV